MRNTPWGMAQESQSLLHQVNHSYKNSDGLTDYLDDLVAIPSTSGQSFLRRRFTRSRWQRKSRNPFYIRSIIPTQLPADFWAIWREVAIPSTSGQSFLLYDCGCIGYSGAGSQSLLHQVNHSYLIFLSVMASSSLVAIPSTSGQSFLPEYAFSLRRFGQGGRNPFYIRSIIPTIAPANNAPISWTSQSLLHQVNHSYEPKIETMEKSQMKVAIPSTSGQSFLQGDRQRCISPK